MNRRLSTEASAEPGQWRTSRAPYQRGIMDCDAPEIVVMKAAQVGWTEILNNLIGFHVDQDPSPVLLLHPTLEMGEAWSKDRLAPMLRDTPCLRDKIADPRSRDSGNTLLHKRFVGGHVTIVGANSPSGLASRPIRILLCDEVDRFPASAGTEGDPIDLARRRTATFQNRKILMGSTPTVKGSSRIEAAFLQSDQRYYVVPCKHCGEFQKLVWEQVKWSEFGLPPEQAVYQCVKCAETMADTDKADMLANGEWRPTSAYTGVAGFHVSELYSPWTTWGEMAKAFVRAKALPETLQTWINTALGETWEDHGEKLEPVGLMVRVEPYTAASLPSGVRLLTAGTDVQDDRLEIFIYGWGADEEAWLIEHVVLRGDPGGQALWAEHDVVLKRHFRTDDGRELVIEACAVDSGGHFTEQVYRYCMARKRFRIFAIKGAAGAGRLAWPKMAGKGRVVAASVWLVGVDTIKAVIYGRLRKVTEPGPGYFHFCAGTDAEFFEQLTSETILTKVSQGRHVRFWKPKKEGARQEALDGTVYAYAAMLGRGGSDLLAARAGGTRLKDVAEVSGTVSDAPLEKPVEPFNAPKAVPAFAPRSNFVNSWRK